MSRHIVFTVRWAEPDTNAKARIRTDKPLTATREAVKALKRGERNVRIDVSIHVIA